MNEFLKVVLIFMIGLPALLIFLIEVNTTLAVLLTIAIIIFVVIAAFTGKGNGFDGRGRDD